MKIWRLVLPASQKLTENGFVKAAASEIYKTVDAAVYFCTFIFTCSAANFVDFSRALCYHKYVFFDNETK